MSTSYISSYRDWDLDKVLVWERPVAGGERTLKLYDPLRYFYVKDPEGDMTAIDGQRVSRIDFSTEEEFKEGKKRFRDLYESDIQPEARVLMDFYYDRPTPIVHYAFLDIEVDYSSKLGFSSPENPYAPINAITIYQSWTQKYLTYAVPPKGWKGHDTFNADIAKFWEEHKLGFAPEITLCANEEELLLRMLADIEDADIISGWNSEFFDNPYIIKRIERVLGKKALAFMCFKGCPPPRERIVKRFGADALTYSLFGRTHLDYLDLFKKFTFEGRASYSLGNIASEELDIPKIEYEGTLEELYKRDFVYFVGYNCRDVEVLVKLDNKFKLMNLVNQMAHENTVPYTAVLGTVRYVETGIMNRAKNVHGLVCTNKNVSDVENEKVEGAIVMTPLAGLHDWIGSVDITSLYPSVIRALNMSVETFIGQFDDPSDHRGQLYGEAAWNGIRAKDDTVWRAGTLYGVLEMTGAEWHQFLRENNIAISAFGTLFDQTKPGMVADTLTFWFAERKRLQAEKKKYAKLASLYSGAWSHLNPDKKPLGPRIQKMSVTINLGANQNGPAQLDVFDAYPEICESVQEEYRNDAQMVSQILEIKHAEFLKLVEYYDLLQLTKKIQLNSTYGALLNEAFRFGRREIGASVTGTGRQISIHMGQTIGELITGVRCIIEKRYAAVRTAGNGDKYVPGHIISKLRQDKNWDELRALSSVPVVFSSDEIEDDDESAGAVYFTTTDEVIYGDTDSCYFMTKATSYDEAVAIADEVAEKTNATFPQFMQEAFNCTEGREKLIQAAREVVAERGLFLLAKKKYTLKVVNLDGVKLDKPKLKSMGSEIKKADTPKVVQDFLKGLMDLMLGGAKYPEFEEYVNKARGTLIQKNEDLLSLGVAKQINNLDAFHAAWIRGGKKDGKVMMKKDGAFVPTNVPGHVRAAINYNELIKDYGNGTDKPLRSGDKGVIFYLNANPYGFKTIAFPSDLMRLPSWFTENFSVDLKSTEKKMIDAKLAGIFEAIGQDVPTPQTSFINRVFQF